MRLNKNFIYVCVLLLSIIFSLYAQQAVAKQKGNLNENQKLKLLKKIELIELERLKMSCPNPIFSNWVQTSSKKHLAMIDGCQYLTQESNLKKYKLRFIRNFIWLNFQDKTISIDKEKVFWSYFKEVEKFAEQGDFEAIFTLAEIYRNGVKKISKPIKVDLALSEEFYEKAIRGNLCVAMSMKSYLLLLESDVNKVTRARELLSESATCGDSEASFRLSNILRLSKDTEQIRRSQKLLQFAGKSGVEDAIEKIIDNELLINNESKAYEQFCRLPVSRRYAVSYKIVKKYKLNRFNNIGCEIGR